MEVKENIENKDYSLTQGSIMLIEFICHYFTIAQSKV